MGKQIIGTSLIGKGYWGSILKKYLQKDRRFNLLYVVGKKYPLSKIWKDKRVNLVFVATPNETHAPLVIEALLAGKNVVVEKPLALSEKDAKRINNLSRSSHRFVITDYTQTFSPGIRYLLNHKKDLGKILFYEMRLGKMMNIIGGQENNIYWQIFCHLLSVLNLFEPIKKIKFQVKTLKNEEGITIMGILNFKKGFLRASVNYPCREFSVILCGEKGVATFNAYEKPTVVINKNGKEITYSFDERNNLRFLLDFVWDVYFLRKTSNLTMAIQVTNVLAGIN